jgi:glycosyltransferase involved in cell wall biosynthesis
MISVVVVTYNRNNDLNDLLSSIDNQTLDKKHYEVIIVDNSIDKNAKKICDKYKKIDLKYI